MRTDELEPNTVYYICLETGNSSTIDYTFTIKNTNSGDNDSEESDADGKEETAAGSNQTNAVLIPLGTKVFGTVRDNFAWYAFTTGDTSGATYNITFVNETVDLATLSAGTNVNEATMIPADVRVRGNLRLGTFAWFGFKTEKTPGEYKITTVNATAGASIIHVYLYDEYGDIIAQEFVSSDGTPVTISTSKLKEDTVYYICLHSDSKLEYSLTINSPEEAQPEENQLVFEVPFEINETRCSLLETKRSLLTKPKPKRS